MVSDPVKGTMKTETNLSQYFKVWFQQLKKHPETYIQAFLNHSAGYISISSNRSQSWCYFYTDPDEILDHSYTFPGLAETRQKVLSLMERTQDIPILRLGYQAGMYTWLSVILVWILFFKKQYVALIVVVPVFISILVCIASPVANCVRYMLPVMAILPIIIGYVRYICFAEKD